METWTDVEKNIDMCQESRMNVMKAPLVLTRASTDGQQKFKDRERPRIRDSLTFQETR